jgi:DNA-binding CsgD family transcriptional regulator
MKQCRVNIGIIEPSAIVYEGVTNMLLKTGQHYRFYRILDIDELHIHLLNEKLNIVIANPSAIQNRIRDFQKIKSETLRVRWIAIVYAYYEPTLLSYFDDLIQISDSSVSISECINKNTDENCLCEQKAMKEQLSEREIDVLIQLVKGLSNKEIADILNISIHTVISHRKNITMKTGIKSESGLTIYAITRKIVSVDGLNMKK